MINEKNKIRRTGVLIIHNPESLYERDDRTLLYVWDEERLMAMPGYFFVTRLFRNLEDHQPKFEELYCHKLELDGKVIGSEFQAFRTELECVMDAADKADLEITKLRQAEAKKIAAKKHIEQLLTKEKS